MVLASKVVIVVFFNLTKMLLVMLDWNFVLHFRKLLVVL